MTTGWSRLLAITSLGFVVAFALPRPCLACSCVTDDPREHLARSDVVFRGRAVDVEALPAWQQYLPWNWDNARRTEARLTVETAWKGSVPSELSVEGGDGGPDCTIRFTAGVEYIVFGQRQDGEALATSRCLGTLSTDHRSEVDALLALLGPGTPVVAAAPTSAVADPDRWPLLLGGVAVLAALAGGFVRRRFRKRRLA